MIVFFKMLCFVCHHCTFRSTREDLLSEHEQSIHPKPEVDVNASDSDEGADVITKKIKSVFHNGRCVCILYQNPGSCSILLYSKTFKLFFEL